MADIQKRPFINKGTQRKDLRGFIRPTYGYSSHSDSHNTRRQFVKREGSSNLVLGRPEQTNPYPENQFGSRAEYDRIMNEVADKIERGEIPRRDPQ